MQFTVGDLADRFGAELRGSRETLVEDVASLGAAEARQLSFVESARQVAQAKQSNAEALLVTAEIAERLGAIPTALLIVTDPFGCFLEAMQELRPARAAAEAGISEQALIHPSAEIGEDCQIHPLAVIAADVKIGPRCVIHSGVVIREGATLGEDCTLHPHVVLYPEVRLGNRVILHAHATIGADGFGYRFQQGRFVRIPHTGTVIVQDDVEIGAGATVDRGMIEATVIGEGTKLDNLVMIAHNCRIGRHNAFASQVGLAGSVTTGDYVRAGGQVGVADHITIGNGVSFGGKAGVISNVPDGATFHGIPAGPEKDEIRRVLTLRKAPQVFDQVKELSKQVAALQEQLAALTSSAAKSSQANTRAA